MRPVVASLIVALAATAGRGVEIAKSPMHVGEPRLVSPHNERGESGVASPCPTFSWAQVPLARDYELLVFEVTDLSGVSGATQHEPLLRVELPAGTSSWTPSVDRCLLPLRRYAWAVGARDARGDVRWSEPAVFRIAAVERAPDRRAIPDAAAATGSADDAGIRPAMPGADNRRSPVPLVADAFAPAACTVSSLYDDVSNSHPLCAYIEQFGRDQITDGCGGGNYCPDLPVTRGQLAVFFERAMRGTNGWRPELGDGATPNLPPAPATLNQPGPADASFSSVTIGADGLALISYQQNPNVSVAHCSDLACSAVTATVVGAAGFDFQQTAIAIGADGLALISFLDTVDSNLKVAHCTNTECTASTLVTLDNSANIVGRHSSITIGGDGLGLIAYFDATAGQVKVAHCANVACSTADSITPLLAATDDTISIATGVDGLGLISYAAGGNVRVAHCDNSLCNAAPVDTLLTAGSDSSIAIGADGNGVVSIYSYSTGDLVVAHCTNLTCSSFDPASPIDDLNNTGRNNSITIGSDGLAIVSYVDFTANDIKVAHCLNLACSSAAVTIVDPTLIADLGTSITIGSDGLPLISYVHLTPTGLRVAHCANVLCVPHFRRR